MNLTKLLNNYTKNHNSIDICCYCGENDCDKIALPLFMCHPERNFETDMCHSECERDLEEDLVHDRINNEI